MKEKKEHLGDKAAVKGTMLQAHLAWAGAKVKDVVPKIQALLGPPARDLADRSVLATDWIPFRSLIEIDRAIAKVVGDAPESSFRELGRHSASLNLGGVYKNFVAEEPHRFFEQMALLHGRFQNFGRSAYERTGPHSGRIRIEGYEEYSPVFCTSGLGYY